MTRSRYGEVAPRVQTIEIADEPDAGVAAFAPECALVYKLASVFDSRHPREQQLLHQYLRSALAANAQDGKSALVAIVSVDRYARIEAMFGSQACDALLRHLVQRLVRRAGSGSSAARVGNDQLIMWMMGLHGAHEAEAAVANMRAACATPFTQRSMCFYLTASMGVAVSPRDGTDASTLLACAGTRMRQEARSAQQRNYSRLTGRWPTQLIR